MRKRPFGATGIKLPVIGQGTWLMEADERETAVAALRRGLDLGMNHIDTAEMYGSGEVEAIVGEAIAGRRDEVFLVSKVLPSNASREGTVAACERTLSNLGVERLDLYLLHWPGEHALEETFAGFDILRATGKIRGFGVSNFDLGEMGHAVEVAGRDRIVCNQVLYHLGERSIEHALIPWCQLHGIAVVAYSPLGQGSFPGPDTTGGGVLEGIAQKLGATAQQVALAFLLRHDGMFVIPKASRAGHVEDNAVAGDLVLGEDEIERISAAFPLGPPKALPVL